MPEIICKDCGMRMFHENQITLDIENKIHKKFCRQKQGATHSYMHKDPSHMDTFDPERQIDTDGKPVLKK